MASHMVRRIKKDLEDMKTDEEVERCGISVEMKNDMLTDLIGKINGPPDTPYEGGNYILEIKVPERYPFMPLRIKFVTKIWHPNISSATGTICLDTLTGAWTPSMSLRTVLLSLQQLLLSPEPDDPLNAIVATQYKQNPEIFRQTAKYWAQVYAGAPGSNSDFREKISTLMNMGVDEERALTVLSFCNWDLQNAVEFACES